MKYQKKALNIESISFLNCTKGVPCKLIIKGILSDPGWQISETKKTINPETRVVSIYINVTRNPKRFAPQVITPVKVEEEIIFPSSGEWTVRCNKYIKKVLVMDTKGK